MLRHFLVYFLLSVLIVIFAKYAHLIIVYIDVFFTYVNLKLTPIFSPTSSGIMIRKIIVLMLLPLVITAIPALLYRAIKSQEMPHFIAVTWVVWTIIVLSNILIR